MNDVLRIDTTVRTSVAISLPNFVLIRFQPRTMSGSQLGHGDSDLPIQSGFVLVDFWWPGVEDLIWFIARERPSYKICMNFVLYLSDIPCWDRAIGLRVWADVLEDFSPQSLLHPSPPLRACHPLMVVVLWNGEIVLWKAQIGLCKFKLAP